MDFLLHPVVWVIIGVLSVARTARLITHDTWPPMEWARPRIAAKLKGWAELVVCPFCVAPYLMAGQIAWFLLVYNNTSTNGFLIWWLVPNAWWACSYLAAIVVAYDQPE
ncbi:MAG TPA: hypothetical protein VIL10_04650 [Marmoricola sp.]